MPSIVNFQNNHCKTTQHVRFYSSNHDDVDTLSDSQTGKS